MLNDKMLSFLVAYIAANGGQISSCSEQIKGSPNIWANGIKIDLCADARGGQDDLQTVFLTQIPYIGEQGKAIEKENLKRFEELLEWAAREPYAYGHKLSDFT